MANDLKDALRLVQAAQVLLKQARSIYQDKADNLTISSTRIDLVTTALSRLGDVVWFSQWDEGNEITCEKCGERRKLVFGTTVCERCFRDTLREMRRQNEKEGND